MVVYDEHEYEDVPQEILDDDELYYIQDEDYIDTTQDDLSGYYDYYAKEVFTESGWVKGYDY